LLRETELQRLQRGVVFDRQLRPAAETV
jgi:hypothetical protein